MKNGGTPKRSARAGELPAEVQAAACVDIPVEPVDAPMWPIHPAGWLQPEVPAAPPSWTGLMIERRHRIPAPDFIQLPLAPFDRAGEEPLPHGRGSATGVRTNDATGGPAAPQSDLAPLGWDPRAASLKKESR